MTTDPPQFDLATLLLHAYELLTHGGEMGEDCSKCEAIETSAEATTLLQATYIGQKPQEGEAPH